MPKTIADLIRNIVFMHAETDAAFDNTTNIRKDLGMDDTVIRDICMDVEETFQVTPFTRQQIAEIHSVASIETWVEAKRAAAQNSFVKSTSTSHPLLPGYSFLSLG